MLCAAWCASGEITFVEIIELRHFSSGDLRPLLHAECEIWQSQLDWDYSGSAEMVLRYVDSKILPGFAALDRGRVLGYAFYVLEGIKGVVGDVFVDRAHGSETASRMVEARLLQDLIGAIQDSPGVVRAEAQLLLLPTGMAAEPFGAARFARHPRLFMARSLESQATAAPHPGTIPFGIRTWEDGDFQQVAGLISAAYLHHVDAEINDQYQSTSGSLRFLNNIVRFPGCGTFDQQSSLLAHDLRTNQIAGVVLCSTIRADVGHVTQICVDPRYRSKGLGELLMESAAARLRHRNFRSLSLTVTQANHGAIGLYEKLGFSAQHIFDAFVWNG